MENGLSLLISVVGLILAVPGALVSFRDWRRGHRSPDKPAGHASGRDTPTSDVDEPTSGPGAGAPVASERRSQPRPHAGAGPAGRVSVPRPLLSFLIDVYALIVLASAVAAVIDPSALDAETEGSTAGSAALSAAMAIMAAGYVVIMGRTGRSLGKLVVGARLERSDTPVSHLASPVHSCTFSWCPCSRCSPTCSH